MTTSQELLRVPILEAATALYQCLERGNKVLLAGNGGSAADAQHFAGELMGRFQMNNRPSLPVVSLTADTAFLTAWANDIDFDTVFSRQIEALGQPGDVFFAISTSGQSENLVKALAAAQEKDMICISLLGKTGGRCAEVSDISVTVPSFNTARIQEVHINVIHSLCEIIEKQLFAGKSKRHSESVNTTLVRRFI